VIELEPQPEEQAALEHAARHARIADGTEQDRVVAPDLLKHRVRQRLAGAVPAARAQVVVGLVEGDSRRRYPQHLERLGHHLGADAVAADDGKPDRSGSHARTLLVGPVRRGPTVVAPVKRDLDRPDR
jgi:hypothetical protein